MNEYLEKLKTALTSLVNMIEESPLFERAVMKFDSLDPNQQRWIRGASIVAVSLLGLTLVFYPVISTMMTKNDLQTYQNLLSEMQEYNAKSEIIEQPAPKPLGWQALSVATPDDAENSIRQYMGQMGMGGDSQDLERDEAGNFSMKLDEISVKQLTALIFQLDGWHPKLTTANLNVKVSPQIKELLDAEISVKYLNTGGGGGEDTPVDSGSKNYETQPRVVRPRKGVTEGGAVPKNSAGNEGGSAPNTGNGGNGSGPVPSGPGPDIEEEDLLPPPPALEEDL